MRWRHRNLSKLQKGAGLALLVSLAGTTIAVSNQSSTAAAPSSFVHPGILVNTSQLNFVKGKLATNSEPWNTAYNKMMTTQQRYYDGTTGGLLSSPTYTPKPVTRVECVEDQASTLNIGCTELQNDAQAAYLHALRWYYKGDRTSGKKAVEIMNAWSAKHTSTRYEYNQYRMGLLVSAWVGEVFPRAAEIMRYTYTPNAGDPALNVTAFSNMLNNIYRPLVLNEKGTTANWLMAQADAGINIGVFTDSATTYDAAVAKWRRELPAMVYMTTDPPKYPQLAGLPTPPDNTTYDNPNVTATMMKNLWYNPTQFISGLEQETCRDTSHMSMGFGAAMNLAETARIQGLDLFGENQTRLLAGLNLHGGYIAEAIGGNTTPTNWKCTAPIVIDANGANGWMISYEIAYNHYANRKGNSMPQLNTVVTQGRTKNYVNAFGTNWQTLTSAGTP